MPLTKIEIYTDGSCLGNPGPGGWGLVIIFDGKELKFSGGDKDTTNNRMEMMAVIKALEWIHRESGLKQDDLQKVPIIIHSDSSLIIKTINHGWKRKANLDLWEQMDKLRAWLNITWTWVKGHADTHHNNLADELAVKAAEKIKKS